MERGSPLALIDVLIRHNVSFVVIGGYAVVYHGYVRTTEDVDLLVRRTATNDAALLAALTELEAFWISDELDPATGLERVFPVTAEYVASNHLMMLGTRFGYLDVFGYVPGLPDVDVDELIRTAERADGRPFVSLEWLKRMKRASGRPKDLQDLANLAEEPEGD